jgi:hypothetical protein
MRSMILGFALCIGAGLSYMNAQTCADGCNKVCGQSFSYDGTRCSVWCPEESCYWVQCLANCPAGKKGVFCSGYGSNWNTTCDGCYGVV